MTKNSAARLATEVLKSEAVSSVFLFGSLARSARDPKDIDLLLFDDGEYSSLLSQYFGPEGALERDFLATPANRAAIQCGWLDYIIVDGKRFGSDRKYTLALAQSQPDPLFFLNLAAKLLRFDGDASAWHDNQPQVFRRLATLRQQLETENIVGPTDKARRRARRRITTR